VNTKDVGDKSQAIILAELIRAGKVVLLPFGDNQRYDLVIDDGGIFTRVQCKTGNLVDGVITFPASSSYTHRGGKRKSYTGEIEMFAVYCPDTDKVYTILVSECPVSHCSLRVDPPLNNNVVRIRWAKDYQLTS